MPGKRPINADAPAAVGASKPPEAPQKGVSSESAPPQTAASTHSPRHRGKVPTALKAIGGLVTVAIVFLVAAVLGGGGSGERSSEPAPAPPASNAPEEKETPAAAVAEELGYPSFATNNTTRVGGSEPVATAAAVALAVYPSVTSAQRPAAVTIVDEGEWQAAVSAAVLMASPVQAPLLVSSGGELPDATSQALAALDPQGSAATDRLQAFAIGSAAAPDGMRTAKAKGANPAALAVAIEALRNKLLGEAPQHFVLASEERPEFSMPAAAWAARSGDAVLYSNRDELPKETAGALGEDPKTPVYVLGPSSAISSSVVREVAKIGNPV